jgi:hypothetical protein
MVSKVAIMRFWAFLIAIAFLLSSCGKAEVPPSKIVESVDLSAAEKFVDAFYSFNRQELESTLSFAEESIPKIAYYQGWAAGGNYTIVNRMPCSQDGEASVSCSITVKEDLMGALGIDFDVTDTFHLSFSEGKIVSVRNSSNDLQVFHDAVKWVWRERPELVRESCKGYFDGGPTPGKCAQAMVRGLAEFAASDEFPDLP